MISDGEVTNDCDPSKLDNDITPELKERLDYFARRIALSMSKRNRQGAHDLVDAGIAALDMDEQPDILLTPITDFGVQMRTANMLLNIDIKTFNDLLGATHDKLLMIGNFGTLTIVDLYQKIIKYLLKRCLNLEQRNKVLRDDMRAKR